MTLAVTWANIILCILNTLFVINSLVVKPKIVIDVVRNIYCKALALVIAYFVANRFGLLLGLNILLPFIYIDYEYIIYSSK
jgi:hypothetical protein